MFECFYLFSFFFYFTELRCCCSTPPTHCVYCVSHSLTCKLVCVLSPSPLRGFSGVCFVLQFSARSALCVALYPLNQIVYKTQYKHLRSRRTPALQGVQWLPLIKGEIVKAQSGIGANMGTTCSYVCSPLLWALILTRRHRILRNTFRCIVFHERVLHPSPYYVSWHVLQFQTTITTKQKEQPMFTVKRFGLPI